MNDSNIIFKEAFLEAKKSIASTKCSKKSPHFIDSFNSLADVQSAVEASMRNYQGDSKSTAKSWLYKFSRRVHYYSLVLDVMVQHHPEYVSLAWGTMKFLFIVAIEHENTTVGLAKALTEIGDLLPQVHLTAELYSSSRLCMALANLYASIMKFLARAHQWCEMGRFSSIKRVAQSVVSPFELRYKDILESIKYQSAIIKELGVSGSQSDVRSIKGTVEETDRKFSQLSAEIASTKETAERADRKLDQLGQLSAEVASIKEMIALNSAALIDTNNSLTDLQFSQILTSISRDVGTSIWEPGKTIRFLTSLRRRQSLNELPSTFYHSRKLRNWTTTPISEVCLVMGSVSSRFALKYFCLDIIHQLRAADVPYLLSLKINHTDAAPDAISTIGLLKYLVKQALEYTKGLQTEGSMSLSCARVNCANSETEWFDILGSVLAAIGKQVYIILDLGMLDRRFLSPSFEFSWLKAFERLFTRLARRGPNVRVKVMLVNYSSSVPFSLSPDERSKFCIPVRAEVTTVRFQRKTRYMKTDRFALRLRR